VEQAHNRPFEPEFIEQARKLAAAGWTIAEMAAVWTVSEDIVHAWCVEHPEFAEAIKTGRVLPDERVEESLFRRAIGYSHQSEKIRILGTGKVVRVATVKHYPPNPVAAMYWLKNRRPDRWRDKPEAAEGDAVVQPVKVELVITDARQRKQEEDDPGKP
jgi:hypothetical protein